MTLSRRRVTGASGLQALGHPLRLALLELLTTQGPKTASQAGVVLGASASNCSWHLRKLAQHGFVREVRGRTGRERPWRVVTEGLTWQDDEVAAQAVDDVILERDLQRLRAARAVGESEPEEWQRATGVERFEVWMTADEVADVRRSLGAMLERHADPRPGTRRVSFVTWAVPTAPG